MSWKPFVVGVDASPEAAAAADLTRMNARIDVRDLLPQIRVPTLVLTRDRDRVI